MKKVSIITLGCKVNQVESEKIAEKLKQNGFEVELSLTDADIFVINTCAVTNEAERKSRNIITKVLKLNPNAEIFICGCSSQHNPENYQKQNVKFIIGTQDKLKIADEIIKSNPSAISEKHDFNSRISNRTRADLWIQNGCNNFCTYCIIPYLRGREVSFPLKDIEKEIKKLEKETKEIVLTGINMSAYGNDIPGSEGLIEVVRLFKDSPSRFRFSSLEVNVITEKFLSELVAYKNFCDHFHLSLQSGSNNTLKAMNRHYTKEEYLEKVKMIRKFFPNAGITTDIIIGFPSETDADFVESLEFAKEVNFSSMHIFPYSKREGTVAAKMKNVATNVPERVKKMHELAEKMKYNFISKNLGKEFEVIIENKKGNHYLAHTPNFILCYIESNQELAPNMAIKVKLKKHYEDGALAEII